MKTYSSTVSGTMTSVKDFVPPREKLLAFKEAAYDKVDKLMDYFMIAYFIFGGVLVRFNPLSWHIALGMGTVLLLIYYIMKVLFKGVHLSRYVTSCLLGMFGIQYMIQMQGDFYYQMIFMVAPVLLIFYRHWQMLLPHFAIVNIFYLCVIYVLLSQESNSELHLYFVNTAELTPDKLGVAIAVQWGQFVLSVALSVHLERRMNMNARNAIYLNDQLNIEANIRLANQIAYGILDEEYEPKENDLMGKTLINMRNSLKEYRAQETRDRWINEGIAHISEVLMTHNEIDKLSYELLYHVVKYVKASQGALFIVEEEEEETEPFLQMAACYAYDKREDLHKKIHLGDDLVGEAVLRKQTIHIKQVPDDYLSISSGMGGSKPAEIMIVPLKLKDQVVGVIELATFASFRDYQVEFMEKLGERIATSLLTVKSNQKNNELLQEAQVLTEQLRAQEDMLRQSMEEIQATQEEVMRSNDKLNALLSNVPGMVFIQRKRNGKWGIEFATNGAKELTGYEPQALMESVVNYVDLIHPDDRNSKEMDDKVAQALEFHKSYEIRYRIIDANNKLKWVWEKGNGVYDVDDSVIGLEGFITDITEEVVANQKVQEQLEEMMAQEELIRQNMEELANIHEDLAQRNYDYNQLMELIDIATIVSEFTKNGDILNVNKNFLELTGYSREELVGKPHTTYVPKHVVESTDFRLLWEKLSKGEYVQQEVERVKKNGEPFWLRSIYFPIKDETGVVKRVFAVNFDITIQKHQENEKHRGMEQLRRVQNELNEKTAELESFRDAIDKSTIVIEFDKNANFLNVNANFCMVSQYTAEEIIGKPQTYYIPEEEINSRDYDELKNHLIQGNYQERDVRRKRKDGSIFWLKIYYVPVRNEKGELVKITCICSDITEEKEQREKMTQVLLTHEEMAQQLKEKEAELEQKKRELQKLKKQ